MTPLFYAASPIDVVTGSLCPHHDQTVVVVVVIVAVLLLHTAAPCTPLLLLQCQHHLVEPP
jgi:hypothetical protein